MRMKRKKNLDERIEASSDYLITMKNDSLDFQDAIKENHLLDFKEIFKKEQPVYLEIGCGKGQFGNTFASLKPDKNILCVERNRNVLIMAIDKARELKLDNIMFLCGTAEYLPSYIPNNSIEEIYLNFSCPFPKNSHEAHRLTNPRFLEIYKPMLKKGSAICQKTDNMHFFEYSIESFSKCGFKLSNISLDLHHSDFEGNIETEYEQKFSSQGYPIYRLEARLS
ncbi:tRNA (guanine-N(7)-)-methyltransferase [Firmicutes bacterium CAG:341]|uniref:tRNA (guanosine(46)-N7)-methyltransferase TrmB n=1 Tax=Eubacterium sp. TaxID=142586 RepID=UPI00033C0316|nr:tRNA (guanine-N(7)-)-methyltransferase [Firmicutes bacterium CAG:341]